MHIDNLDWTDSNLDHIIVRHGISLTEIEDVCFGQHYACSAKYKRKAVYGQASSGRYLLVVLEKMNRQTFRPITARNMTPSERRKYNDVMR
jgi:uncharacterized protein